MSMNLLLMVKRNGSLKMNKFQEGNCVGLPKPERLSHNHKEHFDSLHILSQGDINKGYYWCNNGCGSVDLLECGHQTPTTRYSNRCQTLSGKVTQPISFHKFIKNIEGNTTSQVTTYIIFKEVRTKIKGFIGDDKKIIYFQTNSGFYKTKTWVDELGYLRGLGFTQSHLTVKMKRNMTRFKFEDERYLQIGER